MESSKLRDWQQISGNQDLLAFEPHLIVCDGGTRDA